MFQPRNVQFCLVLAHSLHLLPQREDGLSFSEDQLCSFAQDLHLAGTDTTSNTLLTSLLYMMAHPHIQGPTFIQTFI